MLFYAQNFFVKKIINRLENVFITFIVLYHWSVQTSSNLSYFFSCAGSFLCSLEAFVNSVKLPAMILAWENLQEFFCDIACCCCFTSLEVFLPSLLLDVISHSSVSYRRVFTPILYFQPSSSQSDSRYFHLTFLGFCITALPRVLRFWAGIFYPQAFFTLHSFPIFWHILWLRCGQEHPIQDLALCLPSQSCPFRLTHCLEFRFVCSLLEAVNHHRSKAQLNEFIFSKFTFWLDCEMGQSMVVFNLI